MVLPGAHLRLMRRRRVRQVLCGLFIADPSLSWRATDLYTVTGSGFIGIYLVLADLERAGWLSSQAKGTDPQRFYKPSVAGIAQMRKELTGADWTKKPAPKRPRRPA